MTRRSLVAGAAGTSAAILATSSHVLGAPSTRYGDRTLLLQDKAELVFTYWGSPQEQDAVKKMVENFNDQHDNISVKPQYVPNDGYEEKMTTMLAGGNPPDIAYMGSGMAVGAGWQDTRSQAMGRCRRRNIHTAAKHDLYLR